MCSGQDFRSFNLDLLRDRIILSDSLQTNCDPAILFLSGATNSIRISAAIPSRPAVVAGSQDFHTG